MKRPRRMPATTEPAPVMVQSAHLAPPFRPNDPSWRVPVDVLLTLPTGSAFKGLIQARREKGDWPLPVGTLYAIEGRYYAEVAFGGPGKEERPALFYALDLWPQDIRARGGDRS